MPTMQPIRRGERLVALVSAGQAVLSEHIDAGDLVHVQAMALYALKIAGGEITGPYTDAGAEDYAARATDAATYARPSSDSSVGFRAGYSGNERLTTRLTRPFCT